MFSQIYFGEREMIYLVDFFFMVVRLVIILVIYISQSLRKLVLSFSQLLYFLKELEKNE